MEKINYSRLPDDKYREEIVRQARHDLAVKFVVSRKRVKENKKRNGGIYIPGK